LIDGWHIGPSEDEGILGPSCGQGEQGEANSKAEQQDDHNDRSATREPTRL